MPNGRLWTAWRHVAGAAGIVAPMLRRLRDALILDLVAANAYHLLVVAGRYYSARHRGR